MLVDEIRLGSGVAVTCLLEDCATPHSQRKDSEHRILRLPDWTGDDDEVDFGTQSGSQVDGFCGLLPGPWSID